MVVDPAATPSQPIFNAFYDAARAQPLTREMLKQTMADDRRRREAGEYDRPAPMIVSPAEFIQFTGSCPVCERDLAEVAAADQQLARRQCSCGSFLPPGWRARLRTFVATRRAP